MLVSKLFLQVFLVYATFTNAFCPIASKKPIRQAPVLFESKDVQNPLENEVLDTMRHIIDPDLGNDIVSLGFIKEMKIEKEVGFVGFNVELTTPACPVKEDFRLQCVESVLKLNWVNEVDVVMTSQPLKNNKDLPTGLSRVQNIIAVSSCKGGVGKSTTAVNLAYILHESGAKVGILDADVYGPSLPTMIRPDDDRVEFIGEQIKPLESSGVKLMSYGYVNEGAAIMRGPMIVQLLNQFVSLTSWGELDYLVIDMPPGTGDIQLTMCQNLNITAAVIVTTPQRLSFTDVVKGIDMFDAVNVPSIAVVENMAYYSEIDETQLVENMKKLLGDDSEHQNEKTKGLVNEVNIEKLVRKAAKMATVERTIFGEGHSRKLAEMWGIKNIIRLPIQNEIAKSGDAGTPFVVKYPMHEQTIKFRQLGESVVREVAKIRFGKSNRPAISYDEANNMIRTIEGSDGNESLIEPSDLRKACKCAACIEEFTGKPLLDPASIPNSIRPTGFAPIGNYALSVDWSDGHKSLYPYAAFVEGYKGRERRLETIKSY